MNNKEKENKEKEAQPAEEVYIDYGHEKYKGSILDYTRKAREDEAKINQLKGEVADRDREILKFKKKADDETERRVLAEKEVLESKKQHFEDPNQEEKNKCDKTKEIFDAKMREKLNQKKN